MTIKANKQRQQPEIRRQQSQQSAGYPSSLDRTPFVMREVARLTIVSLQYHEPSANKRTHTQAGTKLLSKHQTNVNEQALFTIINYTSANSTSGIDHIVQQYHYNQA